MMKELYNLMFACTAECVCVCVFVCMRACAWVGYFTASYLKLLLYEDHNGNDNNTSS